MISCTSRSAPPTAGSATAAMPTIAWPRRRSACPARRAELRRRRLVACGFGTAYEALNRVRSPARPGADHRRRTGGHGGGVAGQGHGRIHGHRRRHLPGPSGLCAGDRAPSTTASSQTAGDGTIKGLTDGLGCEVSVDCSGAPQARLLALQGTRRWGRAAMVGEGNNVDFDVSQTIIHNQITIYGSWVTSLGHMEDLVEKLVEWDLKPEVTVTHRFTLDQAADAYRVADEGQSGKVVIVFDEA